MSTEFKRELIIQMHAREVSSFESWSRYLKFVTAVQRAVHSDGDSSSDDAIKDSKKKIRSLNNIPVGERKAPKDLFPNSPLTKDSEWPERTRVTVCLTSTMYSAPMGTSVSAITSRTPNRHLRQLQRTARTHRKYERSSHRCASCLCRRSDCSWRRRSPEYSAAAKMMIRTRHLHCVRIVPH